MMPEKNRNTLNQKKKELEEELHNIQNQLDDSVDKVKSEVSSRLDPLEYVRRHPLPMVTVSLLTGFLAGKEGGKEESSSSSSSSSSSAPGDTLTSTLWYEMKRLATRKMLLLAGDYIEDLFSD